MMDTFFFKAVFQKYVKTYTVSKNTTVLMLMTVNGKKMAFFNDSVHVKCSYCTRLSKNTNSNFVFLERYGWALSHLLDMG